MSRPSNVGICASYIHFPSTFVSQNSLETFDGVSQNKYTLGLGQEQMAFCGPREDTTSLMMTAVSELLSRYNLSPNDIGRLEVGTESLVDKSKSAKTSLMPLFKDNTGLEGVTSINACYGGTAALFHTVDWVESSAWDGRYGLVVCGDVAVYEKGPARPTGGAGVVAMLVGPNAPLVLESKMRATHMEDVYDFYKPIMESEYPIVDGKLSNSCYLRSIDICFNRWAQKFEAIHNKKFSLEKDVQHAIFHLPYTKLVQKSFARMAFCDAKRSPETSKYASKLLPYLSMDGEESYNNRDLEKAALAVAQEEYVSKVFPSTLAGRRIGNIYTGSLYAGLCSLIAQTTDKEIGNRAFMFSYGSGLAATLFSLKIDKSLDEQRKACDLIARLDARKEASARDYTTAMELREQEWSKPNFSPSVHPTENIQPGEYYLSSVDALHRRTYDRVPVGAVINTKLSARGFSTSSTKMAARAFSTIARRLI